MLRAGGLAFLGALICLSGPAWADEGTAAPGTVLQQFAAPGDSPQGLAWDGQHLWLIDAKSKRLYQLDPVNGKVLSSTDAPGARPMALAWDGQQLWTVDQAERKLYRVDASVGQAQPAFDAPQLEFRGQPAPLGGMTFDGQHLWIGTVAGWSSRMNQIDPADGSVTKWYFSKGYPRALTCDGIHLWSASDSGGIRSGILYQYHLSDGVCVSQMDAPGNSPVGLAHDGRHLWYLDGETRNVYKLAVASDREGKP
jgi:sugar lactone lactonase YvrE